MTRRRYGLAVVLLSVAMLAPAAAQAPTAAPPALTDAQKVQALQLVARALAAQVQAIAAQREYETAQRELVAHLATLQVPGYVLDVPTLTYVKAPAAEGVKDGKPKG